MTAAVPGFTTGDVANIQETVVSVEKNVIEYSGGASVTERGVVYAAKEDPTLDDSKVAASWTWTGTYTVNLTDLEQGTVYPYRACAVNSVGTAYDVGKSLSTERVLGHLKPAKLKWFFHR